ncbi:MAG: trigger factor [Nitrospirota bacterium]
MLKSVEDINPTKKRLRIEIPSDVIEKEIDVSLKKLKQQMKIPGFRPGMAPISLIEKRFGKEVEAEVLDRIIPEYYKNALKESSLIPATLPIFDEKFEFKRNSPLNFSFTIEVMPKIEDIQYEGIKVKDMPITVDETEVDDFIKKLQEQKAVYEVAEKDIEADDLVSLEFVDCKLAGEETTPQSIKEQVSKMGNEIFPPDMIERMMGKKKDDIVEFTTTFDENCGSKELVGKTVEIKLATKEIKKKNLPEIDDEFAKDVGFGSIAEMREKIKEKILAAKEDQIKRMQKAEIINSLIESHNFDVPETLAKKEFESLMMHESISGERNKMQDNTPLASPLPRGEVKEGGAGSLEAEKKELERLQADMEKRALRNVQASIIIDAIGKKEGINVTDSEVDERVSLIAQRLSATPEAVRNFYKYKEGSIEGLRHSIYEDKVLDMLLSKAVIEKGE